MVKVITYGTFDLFHEGHYRLLQRAKALGDYLIVGVASEAFDKARGKLNVIDSLMTRIENVKKTGFVDEIIIEENIGQKYTDIRKYGIDIFTVGSDWEGQFEHFRELCQVVYLERTKDISSTMLREQNRHIQRIGIIGTGRIAPRFLRESKLVSGVSTEAVYNPHFNHALEFARKYDLTAYEHIEDFFAASDIVYIASPHGSHYDYIMTALRHGRHVICEKPLALTRHEAESAFALAAEKKCLLIEAIKTAYAPGFQRLISVAFSGRIGALRHVDACFTKLEASSSRELTDTEFGGSFLELASYVLLPIIKLFGVDYESVHFESVNAENGVDVFTQVYFRYKNAMAVATCGLGVKSEGRLVISGTKGYIIVPVPWWKTNYFEVHYENTEEIERYSEPFLGEGLRYEIGDLLHQLDTGAADFRLTREESIALAGIIERFRESRSK